MCCFAVPVCPHAGGVGLCEMVQHLSVFDYVCVARTFNNRSHISLLFVALMFYQCIVIIMQ